MSLTAMHREDVKALLRKRFGSVAAFERARALPEKSVTDVLRGRGSARVEEAVLAIINEQAVQSEKVDCSDEGDQPHRQIAGAK